MKVNRRGFFAAMLAPLLGRLMPKPNFSALNGRIAPFNVSLNGLQEALDDGLNPSWDGNIYPTYGSISSNGFSNTPNWKATAERGIVQEVETRMLRARYELTAKIFEDEAFQTSGNIKFSPEILKDDDLET